MVSLNMAATMGLESRESGELRSRFAESKEAAEVEKVPNVVLTEVMEKALQGGSMRPDVVGEYKLPADATQKLRLNLNHMTFAAFNDPGDDILDFAKPVFTVVRNALMTTPLASVVKVFDNYVLFVDKHDNVLIGFGQHGQKHVDGERCFIAFTVKIGSYKDGLKICQYFKRCKYSRKKTDFQKANCMEKLKIEQLQVRRAMDHAMTDFMLACNLPARTHSTALVECTPVKRARCETNETNQTCSVEVTPPPKLQRQDTIVF